MSVVILDAQKASSSSSYAWPISCSEASARSGLLLVDLRHGEADVDEHPVAGLQVLVLEQPDVDDPADAGDVDARQVLVVSSSSTSWPGCRDTCASSSSRLSGPVLDRFEHQLVATDELDADGAARQADQRDLVAVPRGAARSRTGPARGATPARPRRSPPRCPWRRPRTTDRTPRGARGATDRPAPAPASTARSPARCSTASTIELHSPSSCISSPSWRRSRPAPRRRARPAASGSSVAPCRSRGRRTSSSPASRIV